MRGKATIIIGGQSRALKFGVVSLSIFEKVFGKSLFEVGTLLGSESPGEIFDTLVKITHCGILARASKNNLPVDYSEEILSDWIEDLIEEGRFQEIKEIILPAFTDGIMVFSKIVKPSENLGEQIPQLPDS